jgi:hypothetical protein
MIDPVISVTQPDAIGPSDQHLQPHRFENRHRLRQRNRVLERIQLDREVFRIARNLYQARLRPVSRIDGCQYFKIGDGVADREIPLVVFGEGFFAQFQLRQFRVSLDLIE